jgi:hypothetical protein
MKAITGYAFKEVRKAFAGGIATAGAYITGLELSGNLKFDGETLAGVAGAFAAGAVLVFFVKNTPAAA